MALGLQNGHISVRNQRTEEVCRMERTAPVWCLAFAMGVVTTGKSPGHNGTSTDTELLMVGCWDKTMSTYK